MSGEDSAYRTLGLRPGASQAQLDEAYRRLIKRYHPDRTGGDGGRAAEINRAYGLLRRDGAGSARPRRAVVVPVQPRRRPRRGGTGWLAAGALAVIAAGVVAANDRPNRDSGSAGFSVPVEWGAPHRASNAVARSANFAEPLQTVVIDRAIGDAMRFNEDADPAATLEFSRACHNKLRDEPSLTWFDSCAAFDEATVILTNANPLSDAGPFNASAVMARQMGAARMLSDDLFAADSRMHQIRSRVELALIPKLDEAAARRP